LIQVARPSWIEVGRVAKAHGVRGEVRVVSGSDNPERFVEGSVMYARFPGVDSSDSRSQERMRLTVGSVRGMPDTPILAFREIENRETAESLRGHILEVQAAELPRLGDDEFYPFDLEGLLVKDRKGRAIGHVREVVDSPAHGLLSVGLESGESVLVPFVSAAVPLVEVEKGFLVVNKDFLQTDDELLRG
jgi:16S rRNA processing protein RimM